jgi:UDPglucose--hexose-1-phosphate uridylyltransferase
VFDNLFPSLSPAAHDPPSLGVPTEPALGRCEVVVFTQDPQASLGELPLDHVELLLAVWADRTRRHADSGDARYVLPFENRGVEVGVTLHHPHGQIYAYPFVPPVPARMLENASASTTRAPAAAARRADRDRARRRAPGPLRGPARGRVRAAVRALSRTRSGWPRDAPFPSSATWTGAERRDLARALKTVLLKYDALWQRPLPYLMAWYQAPLDGGRTRRRTCTPSSIRPTARATS